MSERRYEDATRPERWKTPTSNAPALQRALDDIDARLVALEECAKPQPTGDKIPPIHTEPHKPCGNGDTISAEGDGERDVSLMEEAEGE